MAYVEDMDRKDGACPFCITIDQATSLPGLVVHTGKTSYVSLNLYPYNNGHLLVLPHRHVSDLVQLTQEEATEMMVLLVEARTVLEKALVPDGYNIGTNLGSAAGAGIPGHIHFHVVPRWDGDTNFMPVTGDVKVLPETLAQTRERITTAWKNL